MSPGKKQEERAALHLFVRKLALGVADIVRILKMALAGSYNAARKAYPLTQVHHDYASLFRAQVESGTLSLLKKTPPKSV